MMQSVLAIKTLKNFQAMGTALVWVMESFDWLPDDVRDVFSKVKIGCLLRPLTYTLNSSLVLAICDYDLTDQHGHVSAWYQVRALLGSYRTPRLVHLENVITTVIRQVAIGVCESTPTLEELDARLKAKQQADEAEQAQLELERACLEQERITKEKEEEEIRRAAQAARLKEADNRTRREDARKEHLDKELAPKKAQEEKARAARSKQDTDRQSQRDDEVRKPKKKHTVAKASTDVCGKRKGRSESRGCLGSTKKRKVQQQTEEEKVSGPLLEVELNPPEKSKRPLYLTGICPNGVRTVEFPWVGHVDTDRIERPMMENVLLLIDQERPKCFRRHVDGVIPTDPPKDEESDITSPVDIDQILGTGCDVFVEDLLIPGKSLSPGVALRVRHNLNIEMEVQVRGLQFLPQDAEVEKKYPNSLRKTTLRTFLRHANSKDGIMLNCLKLPESSSVSPNLLTGSGLDLEDIAFRQTNGLGGPRGPFAEPEHVPREVQY
ncbi:hypothetical protein K438DRAFT_1776497 [Mycena galopus ATCC 62051]|nr:hypothetical protein K438DRAFT_1776497 [Mycena galopus ATCC 62051]